MRTIDEIIEYWLGPWIGFDRFAHEASIACWNAVEEAKPEKQREPYYTAHKEAFEKGEMSLDGTWTPKEPSDA